MRIRKRQALWWLGLSGLVGLGIVGCGVNGPNVANAPRSGMESRNHRIYHVTTYSDVFQRTNMAIEIAHSMRRYIP